MQLFKKLLLILLVIILVNACTKDDTMPPEDTLPTECKLVGVSTKVDETTSFGIFDIDYDSEGNISEAGLQTYEFTYDATGKLIEATLPSSTLNPKVSFLFAYSGDLLIEIKENWGEEPNLEERYVFTPTYGIDGFIDEMMRTGLGGDLTLDYDYDSNGNALKWTDPTFQDYRVFTFGSDKGLIENLDHTLAFATGIVLGQPFIHFNNVVTSEKVYTSDDQLTEESGFSELEFNILDFQTVAGDPSGTTYLFEYECE